MSKLNSSLAVAYHQRTKYAPETLANKGQGLDWSKQPSPYKEYKIGRTYDLKPYLQDSSLINDQARQGQSGRKKELQDIDTEGLLLHQWQRLSEFLLCSYGLTARLETWSGTPLYLRAAPSAGGLYPAEVYLISGGSPLLPAGLYSYQVQHHALVSFWQDQAVWPKLQQACFAHPDLAKTKLAIVTSAIFYRSAWRYEARAYRRIFLDTGHLLGNFSLAANMSGFRVSLIGGFADHLINQLLFLDETLEGVMSILPLIDLQDYAPLCMEPEALPLSKSDTPTSQPKFTSLASSLQTKTMAIADADLIAALHEASSIDVAANFSDIWRAQWSREDFRKDPDTQNQDQNQEDHQPWDKYNFPFCTKVKTKTAPFLWGEDLAQLGETMLRRRSTREYSGAALDCLELCQVLDFTYQPHHYEMQGLDEQPDFFDLSLIETFVAVSAVDGLESGCYYYAPKAQELRQIRFKEFRQELHYLCLGQDLGRDAAVVIFHTADLSLAVQKYGERAYRYLHMDAGHLGQRMNLAAIHLGLGVSGIGGFFDDQVNELLGIPQAEAVLYITTLGMTR
ncbi:MAG: SagB/ThcOx family dehydrogenase [Pseudanabaena sp. ELA607]